MSNRQIFFDTETTGLDPAQGHRLIEIGAVEMINRRLTGNNFHFYFNPDRPVDPGALAIHGLNDAFLADKPRFNTKVAQLLVYLDGAELIIHNASFDVRFIEHELALAEANIKKLHTICRITDTLTMARQMHPGQKNSLDALCKRYRINNAHRNLHGALLDAQILAQVYLAMTGGQSSLLETISIETETAQNSYKSVIGLVTQSPAHLNYPVHLATPAELAAHQTCLDVVQKKSKGQCLWMDTID